MGPTIKIVIERTTRSQLIVEVKGIADINAAKKAALEQVGRDAQWTDVGVSYMALGEALPDDVPRA